MLLVHNLSVNPRSVFGERFVSFYPFFLPCDPSGMIKDMYLLTLKNTCLETYRRRPRENGKNIRHCGAPSLTVYENRIFQLGEAWWRRVKGITAVKSSRKVGSE